MGTSTYLPIPPLLPFPPPPHPHLLPFPPSFLYFRYPGCGPGARPWALVQSAGSGQAFGVFGVRVWLILLGAGAASTLGASSSGASLRVSNGPLTWPHLRRDSSRIVRLVCAPLPLGASLPCVSSVKL
eukprot:scaffold177195_cov32-Tisochrysis_lutea.AAC.1